MNLVLVDVTKKLDTEEDCIAYLERMRWTDGVRCLKCNSHGISRFQARGKTGKIRHLYQCVSCRYQFSATTGTVFHDSHLPLKKWFYAIALVCESKEGISTNQLARALGVQYKTALHVVHSIREVLEEDSQEELSGKAKADGSDIGEQYGQRKKRQPWEKRAFWGIVETGGRVEDISIPRPSDSSEKTERHETVNTIGQESVRGKIRAGANESFWSLFKRGVTGTYALAGVPIASVRYLPGYMNDLTRVFGMSILSALPIGILLPVPKGLKRTLIENPRRF